MVATRHQTEFALAKPVAHKKQGKSLQKQCHPAAINASLTLNVYDAVHNNLVLSDTITFDPFESIVIVLGGRKQVPADPIADPSHGTFQLAIDEYRNGYNVYMYNENNVSLWGAGAVYNEIVNSINTQGINKVVIIGYSWGGGSAYNLSWRLNENVNASPTLSDITKPFTIPFTAYVDAVTAENGTEENRRPLFSVFHTSQFQENRIPSRGLTGGLSGGDDDINRSYIATINHFNIDDIGIVTDFTKMRLEQKVPVK